MHAAPAAQRGFGWGDEVSRVGDYGWFSGNSSGEIHSVGQKMPNSWGLYDMHGNVSEWCTDWYGEYDANPVDDPVGPLQGSARVLKGGCYFSSALACRPAYRKSWNPDPKDVANSDLGFRVVAVSSSK